MRKERIIRKIQDERRKYSVLIIKDFNMEKTEVSKWIFLETVQLRILKRKAHRTMKMFMEHQKGR